MGKIEHLILSILSVFIKKVSKNKLLILNYHRVQDKKDLFFDSDMDHLSFDWQMALISQYLKPLILSDSIKKLENNELAAGSVVVTFDDGYKDNLIDALPILKKRKVPSTFFIATGFLNGGIMWNDIIIESIKSTKKEAIDLSHIGLEQYMLGSKMEKLIAIENIIKKAKYQSLPERNQFVAEVNKICEVKLPDDLMMNDRDIQVLHDSGMEIGGHTSNHPILMSEENSVVNKELIEGKQYLEKLLNEKITTFAYPNGKLDKDYNVEHAKLVEKAGFKCAVTTNWGINKKDTDHFQLYRFTPWDKTPIMFMLRLLKLILFNKV